MRKGIDLSWYFGLVILVFLYGAWIEEHQWDEEIARNSKPVQEVKWEDLTQAEMAARYQAECWAARQFEERLEREAWENRLTEEAAKGLGIVRPKDRVREKGWVAWMDEVFVTADRFWWGESR